MMETGVVRSFPARPEDLHLIRSFVREQGEMARMPDLALDEMTVAVSEACANSALHSRSREVTIRWLASAHHVEVSVQDQGVFVRRVPGIADGECGWGIPMMMAMIDEIMIREGRDNSPGTMVRLVKNAT